MLSFSISYPDLIKLPYFAYLIQRGDRGWKEAQGQGEDRMTLRSPKHCITTFLNPYMFQEYV
jgi:hypothetical protein